jgi:hypothetical protein
MPRADAIHLGLMLSALALAYLLPFELLLLAYAILGPAHYLTEISWLHDRQYFLSARPIALVLIVVSIAAVTPLVSVPQTGLLIWSAFAIAALAIAGLTWTQRIVLLVVLGAVTAALAAGDLLFAISAVLLPTLIHVSVFTLIFMVLGAHRTGSRTQAALVVVYLAAVALILIVPPGALPHSLQLARLGQYYFGGVAPALGQVLHIPDLRFDSRLTGLLSFVYTYHYLNWFIKADVIGWRRISAPRFAGIAVLSIAATGLYFYNYARGFTVLLALSLLHVVLEFPLNAVSMRQLAGIAVQGFGRQPRIAS